MPMTCDDIYPLLCPVAEGSGSSFFEGIDQQCPFSISDLQDTSD